MAEVSLTRQFICSTSYTIDLGQCSVEGQGLFSDYPLNRRFHGPSAPDAELNVHHGAKPS